MSGCAHSWSDGWTPPEEPHRCAITAPDHDAPHRCKCGATDRATASPYARTPHVPDDEPPEVEA